MLNIVVGHNGFRCIFSCNKGTQPETIITLTCSDLDNDGTNTLSYSVTAISPAGGPFTVTAAGLVQTSGKSGVPNYPDALS